MPSTCAVPFPYEEFRTKNIRGKKGLHFAQTTGRTTVNFRDPDGWHLQLTCQPDHQK